MNPTKRKPIFSICAMWLFALSAFVPQTFALQNPPDGRCFVYPSPTQGETAWVVFNQPSNGTANVYIFNEAGDLVAESHPLNTAGLQQVPLDLTHYRSGVYICRVELDLDSGRKSVLQLFKFIVSK